MTLCVKRGRNVEYKACWMVTGCGREPDGTRVAEFGTCPQATDSAITQKPLPYPVCPLMENPSGQQIREAVRRLVEAAI